MNNNEQCILLESFNPVDSRASEFYEHFYQLLIEKAPHLSKLFNQIEMGEQHKMLARSLALTILIPVQNNISTGLKNTIASHEKFKLTENDFNVWLAAALATIKELDPNINNHLLSLWQEKLTMIISCFK